MCLFFSYLLNNSNRPAVYTKDTANGNNNTPKSKGEEVDVHETNHYNITGDCVGNTIPFYRHRLRLIIFGTAKPYTVENQPETGIYYKYYIL